MTRVPAADIEGVEEDLRQHNVTSVWTTISLFIHCCSKAVRRWRL
jgi:hypothetical protein